MTQDEGIELMYSPTKPPCVKCAHHKGEPKRNLVFRLRLVHRCYVNFDREHPITGEPLREVSLCEYTRNWPECCFEEIK